MSSYLSTTVTKGSLLSKKTKQGTQDSTGHLDMLDTELDTRVWRRGYVQFWRAFKCRCMLVQCTCAHDGGTGSILIGCLAQSFGAGGENTG